MILSLGLAFGASAQHGHFGGGGFHGGGRVGGFSRTYVGVGFGLGYPWGYPYGWYGPWYAPYPPYYYGYGAMPSQLELQVEDIRQDFDQQIKDVKHDKSLTRQERRAKVNELKQERENAIVQARHDYFDRSRRNYNSQPNNSQPNQQQAQPKNGNGSSSSEGPEYRGKKADMGDK